MNPIALIEATAATRDTVQGALATDPVAWTADAPAARPTCGSAPTTPAPDLMTRSSRLRRLTATFGRLSGA
jgi:hypothetical protein